MLQVPKKYIADDAKKYKEKEFVQFYEMWLKYKKITALLPRADTAFYCENLQDFDTVVDYFAYGKVKPFSSPYYETKPIYHYSKREFAGPDWYFFYFKEYDYASDFYRIESLTEKEIILNIFKPI